MLKTKENIADSQLIILNPEKMDSNFEKQIRTRLANIYGSEPEKQLVSAIIEEAEKTKACIQVTREEKWDESDTILITYGDSIISEGTAPLKVLLEFINKHLAESLSTVHILPYFPYSSDDGFSVIDYYQVNPELGTWNDIEAIASKFQLMCDLVINHISQKSTWFQNYLQGKKPGVGYFIEEDPETDLSKVVRPRSLPLLSPYSTIDGEKHVWTTFSADQVDLNFSNPELLLEMVKIFLFYLQKQSRIIRLDAIAFLWKEVGTTCLHLPQTHEFVKLMRDLTEFIDSSLILLTETNVPNKENLSYFGNNDEAHMVYQFSLPPLLLHALYTGNSSYLIKWTESLPKLSADNTYFNFTASHDGIGVRPLEGLLPKEEFHSLILGMKNFGGHISTKRNSDGTDSPYEMNITYFDALQGTQKGKDAYQVERFLCSQTIMMVMQGVPAFYIHSFLGTKNYHAGVNKTGMPRTINRRKWELEEIEQYLLEDTHHSSVMNEMNRRIKIRRKIKAFHPNAPQEIVDLDSDLFLIKRRSENQEVFCLSNLTNQPKEIVLAGKIDHAINYDLLNQVDINIQKSILLTPYQTIWASKKGSSA